MKFCNFASLHVSRPCVSTDSLFREWKKHKKKGGKKKKKKRKKEKRETSEKNEKVNIYTCMHIPYKKIRTREESVTKKECKVEKEWKKGENCGENSDVEIVFDDTAERGEGETWYSRHHAVKIFVLATIYSANANWAVQLANAFTNEYPIDKQRYRLSGEKKLLRTDPC